MTTRTAESWHNSISKTIFKIMGDAMSAPPSDEPNLFGEMLMHMILENTFSGDLADRNHCIDVFNKNVQAVKDTFSGDKLFVYNIGDGWDGLCKWLDVPVTDTPFPRTNNQQEFFELAGKLS